MSYNDRLEKAKKMASKLINKIEASDNFAMASDGPVLKTFESLGELETDRVLRAAYLLSKEVMHL